MQSSMLGYSCSHGKSSWHWQPKPGTLLEWTQCAAAEMRSHLEGPTTREHGNAFRSAQVPYSDYREALNRQPLYYHILFVLVY